MEEVTRNFVVLMGNLTYQDKCFSEKTVDRAIHHRLRAVDVVLRKFRSELAAEVVDQLFYRLRVVVLRTIQLSFATKVGLRHFQESDC